MRKIGLSAIFIVLAFLTSSAQIGIGTNTPDASAQLDVVSANKGFLPPRIALIGTNLPSPVTNPATGLLVFNTATSGGTPTNVQPGYYYWNGTSWYPVANKGNVPGDMQYWNGSRWIVIPLGLNGQVLTICNGVPVWGPCSTTTSISPANNQYEGYLNNLAPNVFDQGDQVLIQTWTFNGNLYLIRQCIKFDLSSIPMGAVIDSAKLFLYADATPINGNQVDAMYGNNNSCTIQRITTNWTLPTPFTWNSPPAITTQNQVLIPQSTAAFENSVMNVTQLVKDMHTNGNNGFFIKLQSETIYNSRQYENSLNPDAAKRPKLVVSYH